LEEEFNKEMEALEKKYEALYAPYFSKRTEVVSGAREPTQEEVAAAKAAIAKRDTEDEAEGGEPVTPIPAGPATNAKGVPQFWLTTLLNSEFGQIISEKDKEALKYLTNVTTTEKEDEETGLNHVSLTFTFDTNPFFTNTVLTKTYNVQEMQGQLMIDSIDPAEINWNEGKNLCYKKVTKTVGGGRGGKRGGRGGNKGGARQVTSEEPVPSFFHFFAPNLDMFEDEEEAEAAQEEDFELGMTLKEEIVPNAVLYFTGEVGAEDDDDEEMEFGEVEDEDDDEDEEDEDDDSAPPAQGQQQQECKQQ